MVAQDGSVSVQMCSNHREYYDGRLAGRECQHSECFEVGILMEFRGMEILERPVRLQTLLDKPHAQVADGLLSERLTAQRRCKEELRDRVLSSRLTGEKSLSAHTDGHGDVNGSAGNRLCKQSASPDPSAPVMPGLIDGLSDNADVRTHPVPTHPICEYVTWEDHAPAAPVVAPSSQLKEQAMHLTQRTPSRRGSLVESSAAQALNLPPSTWFPPPTTGRFAAPDQMNPSSEQTTIQPVSTSNVYGDSAPMRRTDTTGLEVPLVGPSNSHPYRIAEFTGFRRTECCMIPWVLTT